MLAGHGALRASATIVRATTRALRDPAPEPHRERSEHELLGPFQPGFVSLRKMLSASEEPWAVFQNGAREVAGYVARGLDKSAAVDALHGIATAFGLIAQYGDDAVTAAIADALREKQNGPDERPPPHEGRASNGNEAPKPYSYRSSDEFVRDFIVPDYLIDGILQRGFSYSLTGRTGSGKTALALLFAAHVAMGKSIGKREVPQGRVLYFAGENPDDLRMRWIAFAPHMDFDVKTILVDFIPTFVDIDAMSERICEDVKQRGELALVIVDTSIVYFLGDDENNSKQQAEHAKRLRKLGQMLPGRPTVLTLCHPVKNAAPDNLIPRGAGSFLNEVDGNLTCARDDLAIELHWQGKFRGADFAPMLFALKTVTHERLKDSKGRLMPTVIAACISEAQQEEMAKVGRANEDLVLVQLKDDGSASEAKIASALGWRFKNSDPDKSKVHRAIIKLRADKLITGARDGYVLTKEGIKACEKIAAPDLPLNDR